MSDISKNTDANDDYHSLISAKKENEILKEKLFELYMLYNLSKNLNLSTQMDEFFDKSILFFKDLLNIEDFCLMLIDDESKELKIIKADENTFELVKDITFKIDEGISGIVVRTGESMVIQDVSKEERFLYYKGKKSDIGSCMSLPLKLNDGRVIGVLNIHKREINAFMESDEILFCTIANNMAHTIDRLLLYEKARRQAMFDDLTNLYTRRYFLECCEREYNKAKRYGDIFSIIMMDIDHFKYFNDTYGHPMGDEVLKKVASFLQVCVRHGDVVSRYGGEEFALLLPGTNKEGATATAEKIKNVVERSSFVESGTDSVKGVTITAGVATYPVDGDTVEGIMAMADKYLYIGKESGRNRVINVELCKRLPVKGEKRLSMRLKLSLKVAMGNNQPQFFEVRVNETDWKLCNIKNISRTGLKGEIEHDIESNGIYTCRMVMDSDEYTYKDLAVKIAYTKKGNYGRCQFGAEILDGGESWEKYFISLTR